jgi:hypothetical protein
LEEGEDFTKRYFQRVHAYIVLKNRWGRYALKSRKWVGVCVVMKRYRGKKSKNWKKKWRKRAEK